MVIGQDTRDPAFVVVDILEKSYRNTRHQSSLRGRLIAGGGERV